MSGRAATPEPDGLGPEMARAALLRPSVPLHAPLELKSESATRSDAGVIDVKLAGTEPYGRNAPVRIFRPSGAVGDRPELLHRRSEPVMTSRFGTEYDCCPQPVTDWQRTVGPRPSGAICGGSLPSPHAFGRCPP